MPDLRLISILPPQTVSGIAQQASSPGVSPGAALLAALPVGTTVSGFIINRDALGNPILRTDKGDVTFQSNFYLKIGSEVVLRIENPGGRNLLAHLLSVDGQSPEVAARQSAFAQDPEVIVSQNLNPKPNLTTGAQLTQAASTAPPQGAPPPIIKLSGTLLTPAPSLPGSQAPLPAGTQLVLTITNVTLPPSAIPEELVQQFTQAAAPQNVPVSLTAVTAPPAAALTPSEAQSTTPATTPPANPVAPPSVVQTPASAPNISTASYILPSNPPLPPALASIVAQPAEPLAAASPPTQGTVPPPIISPTSITAAQPLPAQLATVISHEPGAQAIVQTPLGIVRLQPDTALPTGTKLAYEVSETIMPPNLPQQALTSVSTKPAPVTELARQWSSLQTIFGLLTGRATETGLDKPLSVQSRLQASPGVLGQAIDPRAVSDGVLRFLAAMKAQSFERWLGDDAVRWLKSQGHEALVARAGAEFLTIARQFVETAPQQWQALFFPVAVEGQLQQVRAFIKRDREKQGNNQRNRTSEDTRFVIEVDLTQLGELQMDGFVRQREKDLQFDLMIRSLAPLSPEIQQDILAIYTSTAELTGFKGGLVFQHVREFPVNPMQDIVSGGLDNVIA